MKPILIMSSERSGSNLLRRILGTHSSVVAPRPAHLWKQLTRLLPFYDTIDSKHDLVPIVEDAISITRMSLVDWQPQPNVESVLRRVEEPTVSGVALATYETYAALSDESVWVCKENHLFEHAFKIVRLRPDTGIIYLVRDGRDVALSREETLNFRNRHIYHMARLWDDEQRQSLEVHQELFPLKKSLLVRYEDLLDDPESVVRKICRFTGLDYEESMMRYHMTSQANRDASSTEAWTNIGNPVMKGNRGKFIERMSERKIRLFEAVAWPTLKTLGYPVYNKPSELSIGNFERGAYTILNMFKLWLSRHAPKKEAARRLRIEQLEEMRKRRREEASRRVEPIEY